MTDRPFGMTEGSGDDVLERLGYDLTAQARRGDLEPVRCRDEEISRVVDILLRQTKHNPALVGDAGVGKTAIVEGLAQRIVAQAVPAALRSVRIVSLDHVALLAGTVYRGQYEERLRRLVKAVSEDPDVILFVDELHNLIGQGTAMGAAMDAANMLKPALVRADIRVIGATTQAEYDRWVKGDPALERRFQPVLVRELTVEQTMEILQARRPRLEHHHAVAIEDDALQAALVLTGKFVTDRLQPDKAIDVLDEACAHAQATATLPAELERIVRERRRVDAAIRRRLARGERVDGGGNGGRAGSGEPVAAGAAEPDDPLESFTREIGPALERLGAEIEKLFGGPGAGGPGLGGAGGRGALRPAARPRVPARTPRPPRPRAAAGPAAPGCRGAGQRRRPRRRRRRGQADRVDRMKWRPWALLLPAALAGACARPPLPEAQSAQAIADSVIPGVERAVGLKFRRPPVIEVRSREAVRGYLSRKLAEDLPPSELTAVERTYRAFGVVPDSVDLRKLMLDLYAEQVAGYYDPDSAALFVVRGADPVALKLIMAHELVHALQDEYTSLNAIMKLRRENDRQMAGQAVAEGQATVASIQALAPGVDLDDALGNWDEVRRLIRSQQAAMPVFAAAPAIIRESLLFPYLAGAQFMRDFDARRARPDEEPYGDRMPISTAQVLHPHVYAMHQVPERLGFARSPARDTLVYDDDFGEFETRISLETWGVDTADAVAAAMGWNGDRFEVLGTPAGTAVLWASAWTTPADAAEFERALVTGWARRTGVPSPAGGGADYGAGAGARRWRVERLDLEGTSVVRLLDAPERWDGWARPPGVMLAAGSR